MYKVKGSLVGVDGNAFSLMGHFSKLAKEQKIPKKWVDEIIKEAMSGSYNELIYVLSSNMEEE